MTDVDCILLSRFYQISKISVLQLELILPKISNKELQTEISNQIASYDILATECCTLAKAHKISLPDYEFFKRCRELIDENFNQLSSISHETIIAITTTSCLNTLIEIYNVESGDSETINIGKHLQNMQCNNLQMLKQFK